MFAILYVTHQLYFVIVLVCVHDATIPEVVSFI